MEVCHGEIVAFVIGESPGVTHNPDKPPLACVNNLRIVSINRCSGNI
jgi:hypothetical protein